MGGIDNYHITMLVCRDQEEAIRVLFKERNWPCWLKVVSNEEVINIIQCGFTDVFAVPSSELGFHGDTTCGEVKSECINIKKESNTSKEHKMATLKEIQQSSCNKSNFSENRTQFSDDEHISDKSVEMQYQEVKVLQDSDNTHSDNDNESSDNIGEESGSIKQLDNENVGHCYTNAENDFANSALKTLKRSTRKLRIKYAEKKKSNKESQSSNRRNSSRRNRKQDMQLNTNCEGRSNKIVEAVKKTKFQCTMCGLYLSTKPSLQRHCQAKHADEWFEFKCNDCPAMFKKLEELWKHRNEAKHDPPKVQPKFSEKKNLSPEELEQLGHLKCNACGKILPSRRLLRRHFYSDHRECMPGPLCAVCGMEFKTRQELWKHKREMKHNDSLTLLQTYQCEECGKVLTGGYHSFKLHQRYACKDTEEEPRIKCDICEGMFKSKTHLQQHKKRAHIEVPIVCDICGSVCKNKHALNSHKRRHDEKNKKYACDLCGKAFINNILLKMHTRTHTKEKPFKCPLCDYRCAIKQNIQKHSNNVHKTRVKCADIVTIAESGAQPSDKTPQLLESEVGFTEILHSNHSSQVSAENVLHFKKSSQVSTENISHSKNAESQHTSTGLFMPDDSERIQNKSESHMNRVSDLDNCEAVSDSSLLTNRRALLTNHMPLMTNLKTLQTKNRSLLTNNRPLLTNNRQLLESDKSLLTDEMMKGWKSLTNDGFVIPSERVGSLSNEDFKSYFYNTGKSYVLTDAGKSYVLTEPEGAYDLSICRQSTVPSSGNGLDKVTTETASNHTIAKETPADSFTELVNCSVNPLNYTHSDTINSHYPCNWEHN